MRPHSVNFDYSIIFLIIKYNFFSKDMIYQPVLQINSPRIITAQISNQTFIWRRILKGIPPLPFLVRIINRSR